MEKYCRKCGGRLDDMTGFCPNCEADLVRAGREMLLSEEKTVVLPEEEQERQTAPQKADAPEQPRMEEGAPTAPYPGQDAPEQFRMEAGAPAVPYPGQGAPEQFGMEAGAPAVKKTRRWAPVLIVAIILLAGGGGAAWYLTQGQESAAPAAEEPSQTEQSEEAQQKAQPKLYYSASHAEDPFFDSETGETYYPNEMIFSFEAGADIEETLDRLLRNDEGLQVIGRNDRTMTALLSCQGARWSGEEGLEEMRNYEAVDGVESVSRNFAILTDTAEDSRGAKAGKSAAETQTEEEASDKQGIERQDESSESARQEASEDVGNTDQEAESSASSGKQSGSDQQALSASYKKALDSIQADSLREYAQEAGSRKRSDPVRIGIIETGTSDPGGASDAMKEVIARICPKGGYRIAEPEAPSDLDSSFALNAELTRLVMEKGCRVICFDAQQPVLSCAASRSVEAARYQLQQQNAELMRCLKQLDEVTEEDILICSAAGDQSQTAFERSGSSDYGYVLREDMGAAENAETAGDAEAVETAAASQECLAEYNLLNGIGSDERDALQHISVICAGASVRTAAGRAKLAGYSQSGDPVRILAPGERQPQEGCGTALAAACISGAAADLILAETDITAQECAARILDAAQLEVSGTDRKMIDCSAVAEIPEDEKTESREETDPETRAETEYETRTETEMETETEER